MKADDVICIAHRITRRLISPIGANVSIRVYGEQIIYADIYHDDQIFQGINVTARERFRLKEAERLWREEELNAIYEGRDFIPDRDFEIKKKAYVRRTISEIVKLNRDLKKQLVENRKCRI